MDFDISWGRASRWNTKTAFERENKKVTKRVKISIKSELNDANLTAAINTKVISVARHPIRVSKYKSGNLMN